MARSQNSSTAWKVIRSYQLDEDVYVVSVAFSSDGSSVAIAYAESSSSTFRNKVLIWSISDWKKRTLIRGCSESVSGLAFSHDGQTLYCVGGTKGRFMGGEITFWDTQSWKATRTIEGEEVQPIRRVAVGPDDSVLVTGSALSGKGTDKLSFWDPENGECLYTFGELNDDVKSLMFSPNAPYLATGVSGDRTATMWSLADMSKLWSKRVHSECSDLPVLFSPDGTLLATCGDKNIGLWDSLTGDAVAVLKGHQDTVNAISFSHDGALLFSGGREQICVWDVPAKKLLHSEKIPDLHVRGLAISADNGTLTVVHSMNSEIRIQQFQLSLPAAGKAPQAERPPKPHVQQSPDAGKYISAIIASPDDDEPRLAYAEWLDQQGDPRGEFIRVQCQLHELQMIDVTDADLAQQSQKLLDDHFDEWTSDLAALQIRLAQVEFSRGFISKLELCDVDVTDDSLKALAAAPELEVLNLSGSAVTDAGLKHLAAITNLRDLDVSETQVTTDKLNQLDRLERLVRVYNYEWGNKKIPKVEAFKEQRNQRFLELPKNQQRERAIAALQRIIGYFPTDDRGMYSRISYSQSWSSDADLVYLQAFPEVTDLDFFECRAVTSAGMEHLRLLPQLRILSLNESGVTDLKPLRQLTSLEELNLDSLETLVPGSFRYLPELKNLQRLFIRGCELGDEILPHIAKCTELRELAMTYNEFSSAGLQHLLNLKKLEKLDIDYEDDNRELINKLLGKGPPKKRK